MLQSNTCNTSPLPSPHLATTEPGKQPQRATSERGSSLNPAHPPLHHSPAVGPEQITPARVVLAAALWVGLTAPVWLNITFQTQIIS